jgi:hypothetical protein
MTGSTSTTKAAALAAAATGLPRADAAVGDAARFASTYSGSNA